jgi:SNF2 family DNA or RNA helicase
MHILHALWTSPRAGDSSRLWIWAESLTPTPPSPTPDTPHPLHPGAADTHTLLHALAPALRRLPHQVPVHAHLPVRLPAIHALKQEPALVGASIRPAPSPRLAHLAGHSTFAGADPDWTPAGLTTVAIPALGFVPADAYPLLARLEETWSGDASDLDFPDHSPLDDNTLGPTIQFFLAAARLTRHLLVQQRFVPSLRQEPSGELRGLWQPWLSDERTAQRVALLLRAMPPAARAALDDHNHHPWPILEDFLSSLLDAHCRAALLHDGMDQPIRERRPDEDPQVAWLAGLLADTDHIPASAPMRTDMVKSVRRWIAGLEDRGLSSAWRLLLRLSEPEDAALLADLQDPGDSILWTLSFHLQSQENQSLIVDASDVWLLPDSITLEGRRLDNPQELLLAELGRASRLYPLLEQALGDSEPTALHLDTRRAYQFLRELRPILHEQGFGVHIPDWWDQPSARLGARLKLTSDELEPPGHAPAAQPRLGLHALVGYSWDISLGGMTLSLHEFEQLAARRTPLVRINGRWVEVRPDDLRAAVRFIQENPGGQMQLGDAIRLAYSTDSRLGHAIPIVGVEATGWVSMLFGLGDTERQQIPIVPPPTRFHGSLRPYQIRGVSWLAFLERFGFGPCLADDMGLGKTIQLLALLAHERESVPPVPPVPPAVPPRSTAADLAASATPDPTPNSADLGASPWSTLTDHLLADAAALQHDIPPTLLVVPMSVVGNWIHEIRRFCPDLRILVHHGPERLQAERFLRAARAADAVITTYALAHRDRDLLQQIHWQRVVLDEAQYIKNPGTKQSVAVRSFNSGTRIALTGTPVENRLTELWSILDFLNPGYLGPAASFRKRFAVPVERYHDAQRGRQLRELVRPFILRRLKTDPGVAADLPDKLEMREFCHLTPEQASLYESLVQRMLTEVDHAQGMQRRGLVLSTLVKLKQICNHPAQYLKQQDPHAHPHPHAHTHDAPPPSPARSGKCVRLIELLTEVLAAGDQALVFTQFRQMGEILAAMLRHELDREVLFFHGGTTQPQRVQMVDRFQRADGSAPILLVSLKAGGVGLNLTAATHVFHFDRWWNPAVENQATDRAHRIGQFRTVQVHKFVVSGTLEERIDAMIEQKTELAHNIIGSGEQYLTELSTDQLREILTLRREAVGDEDE